MSPPIYLETGWNAQESFRMSRITWRWILGTCIRLHPLASACILYSWHPFTTSMCLAQVEHPENQSYSFQLWSIPPKKCNCPLSSTGTYSSLLAVINSPVLLNPLCLLVELLQCVLQNDAYFDFGRVKPLRHYSTPPHGSCVLTSQNSCWAHQKLRTPIWSYYCLPPPNMDKEW